MDLKTLSRSACVVLQLVVGEHQSTGSDYGVFAVKFLKYMQCGHCVLSNNGFTLLIHFHYFHYLLTQTQCIAVQRLGQTLKLQKKQVICWKTGFIFTDRPEGGLKQDLPSRSLIRLSDLRDVMFPFSVLFLQRPLLSTKRINGQKKRYFWKPGLDALVELDSEWDVNCKIMYFQLLSQYMEIGPHIAVLMNRLKNGFYPPFLIFIVLTIIIILTFFSVLQGVAQNPKAGSKGLISACLQGKLYAIDLFQAKILYSQKRD